MGPCISTSSTATPDPSGARFAAFCVGLAWRATNLTFSGPASPSTSHRTISYHLAVSRAWRLHWT